VVIYNVYNSVYVCIEKNRGQVEAKLRKSPWLQQEM